MSNALKLTTKLPTDKELETLFGNVNALQRFKVADRAVRAGAKVIKARAQQLAPRGNDTDRRKRSKKQRSSADWDRIQLYKTINYVLRKSETGGLAIIGPEWPHGNKAYFNQPRSGSRKQVLWGKMTRLRPYIAARNWIVQAFDESKSGVLAAMKSEIRKAIDEVMRG